MVLRMPIPTNFAHGAPQHRPDMVLRMPFGKNLHLFLLLFLLAQVTPPGAKL
jgi:hypothetical protein